ncbi:MAG: hypothetical protein MO852_06535 [Candidatus Devosia euplotis]|nr:hypothetical protein [Candidatus Devosia euplotis]
MQESNLEKAKARKPVAIEVGGEPLGVVAPHVGGYRFLAVKLPAFSIDGQQFETVEKAHFAVSQAVCNNSDNAA